METQAHEVRKGGRRYQSRPRGGPASKRKTVILPAGDAAKIERRAEATGLAESAVIALIVSQALAGDETRAPERELQGVA